MNVEPSQYIWKFHHSETCEVDFKMQGDQQLNFHLALSLSWQNNPCFFFSFVRISFSLREKDNLNHSKHYNSNPAIVKMPPE